MIDAMPAAPVHVLVSMRVKTEWVVDRDEKTGKTAPRKVGLQPIMREGIEYEFGVCGEMDRENTMIITKSRCPAVSGGLFPKPGKELAALLRLWLNGEPVESSNRVPPEMVEMWKRMSTKEGAAVEFARLREALQQRLGELMAETECRRISASMACGSRTNSRVAGPPGCAPKTCSSVLPKRPTVKSIPPRRKRSPMQNELAAESARCVTLYDLERDLCSFAAAVDETDDPTLKAELLEELGTALRYARAKRDRVAAFIRHCELQEAFADEEVERLKKRRDRIARVRSELEAYVVQVIEQLVEPDRRGLRRLDGNHSSTRIQRNPDSVALTDVDALPASLKSAVITLPALVWQALLDCVPTEDRAMYEALVQKLDFKPDKRAVAVELKAGSAVPGAHLKAGDFRLVLS